ncbi:MAG TPA: hypothetical protein VFX21_14865 [Acidimicrobiia bacterium]|nr:hypothetical protein [Acidimicrobiia bacterium]
MSKVTVTPDPFTLIAYDAAEIRAITEDIAAMIDFPTAVDIDIEVDEELFAPLVGHASDFADGRAHVWVSGANFEDNRRPRTFSADQARRDLTLALLRAKDRTTDEYADAPPDRELTRAERAAWDVHAAGRAAALGFEIRRQALLYEFRLQHGFSDVADAAFVRLWDSPSVTFAGIREICVETGGAERGDSKIPVDLLRQK